MDIKDFEHPLIKELKRHYENSYNATELADRYRRNRLGSVEQLYKEALAKSDAARTKVSELIKQMKTATNIPEEKREEYISFAEPHLTNITGWYEEAQRFLSQSTEAE